jgi:hypothetical protein
LQTAIPNCESRKAYAQLLLNEDLDDMDDLLISNRGDNPPMVDRVDENFEPYSVDVLGFGSVSCANANVDFACETPISGTDFIPLQDCTVCGGGVNKEYVLVNRWCKAEEILSQ